MEKLIEISNKVADCLRSGKIRHPLVLELLKEVNKSLKYISQLELDNMEKDCIINSSIIRPTKIDLEKISLQKLLTFTNLFAEASEAKCKMEINKSIRAQPFSVEINNRRK